MNARHVLLADVHKWLRYGWVPCRRPDGRIKYHSHSHSDIKRTMMIRPWGVRGLIRCVVAYMNYILGRTR